jgi:hypothetical protein
MPKINIPFGENGGDNYTDEAQYLSTLIYKKDKTSSGTATYTSFTSKKIYSTDDYPDDAEIYNKGEIGLIHIFWKLYGGKDGFLELADDANTYIRPSLTNAIYLGEENVSRITSNVSSSYKIMTVLIDTTDSDPTSSVTYADDAVNMTAGSSDWDKFFGHYPVLFSAGEEVGKLNPNNFTQFEDGATADISSGSAGDVMIAFPRMGIRIQTVNDTVRISMTDNPDDGRFKYYAHSRGDERKEVFYLGAYKGYVLDSKLRSIMGYTPTTNYTIGDFRTYAQNNGTGYEQSGFYQLVFRHVMYLLKYKTLDSQTAIGKGYQYTDDYGIIVTGGTEEWGMDSEFVRSTDFPDDLHHVKLFGIEDEWGNINEWIDGCITDDSSNVLTTTDNFNDDGDGYTEGQNLNGMLYGFISEVQGTTEMGFIAKVLGGSSTTYFCDYAICFQSCCAYHGTIDKEGGKSGIFNFAFDKPATSIDSYIGTRLMYL